MNVLMAIPPVLAPIPWGSLCRVWWEYTSPAETAERAAAAVASILGNRKVFFFASGRAAMVAALRALRRGSAATEVIIPAYTCYTVPSAVAAAGLVAVPCDLSETNYGFDPEALERCFSADTLCVIPTHLYGIPCAMDRVQAMARERGVAVLEDAAQALGGSWEGRRLGTLGDIGLVSLGRGKNVTAGHGGILVVEDGSLAVEIEAERGSARRESLWRDAVAWWRTVAVGVLARPPFYGALERIPALEIGVSRFDPDITVGPLEGFETRLAARVLALAEQYRRRRAGVAERYLQELHDTAAVRLPQVPDGGAPAWLRFPILVPEPAKKRLLGSAVRHLGLSGSYPASVPEIPGIGPFLRERADCPGAQRVAREILTLPTHPRVREGHIQAILDCLRGLR